VHHYNDLKCFAKALFMGKDTAKALFVVADVIPNEANTFNLPPRIRARAKSRKSAPLYLVWF